MKAILGLAFLLIGLGACESEQEGQVVQPGNQPVYQPPLETGGGEQITFTDTSDDIGQTGSGGGNTEDPSPDTDDPDDKVDDSIGDDQETPELSFNFDSSLELGEDLEITVSVTEADLKDLSSLNFYSDDECEDSLDSEFDDENGKAQIQIEKEGTLELFAKATLAEEELSCLSVGSVEVQEALCDPDADSWEGEGTETSPYIICNSDHLADMTSDKHYALAKDIQVSSNWNSISTFKGNLDGKNNAILGLNKALFEVIGTSSVKGTVTNLVLGEEGESINSSEQEAVGVLANKIVYAKLERIINNYELKATVSKATGGLAGEVIGKLEAEYLENNGDIQGNHRVGGFFGEISPGADMTLERLKNTAKIKGANKVGAIIGNINESTRKVTLKQALNTKLIEGTFSVGGLIGKSESEVIVKHGRNDAEVRSWTSYAGGIIGQISKALMVENSMNNGLIVGSNKLGGIVGRLYESGNCTISESKNTGIIIGDTESSGNAGIIGTSALTIINIKNTQNSGSVFPNELKNDAILGDAVGNRVDVKDIVSTGDAPYFLGSLTATKTIDRALNLNLGTSTCEENGCYSLKEDSDNLEICKSTTCEDVDEFLSKNGSWESNGWSNMTHTFSSWVSSGNTLKLLEDADSIELNIWTGWEDTFESYTTTANSSKNFSADWLSGSSNKISSSGKITFKTDFSDIKASSVKFKHSEFPGLEFDWDWEGSNEFPWGDSSALEE